MRKLLFFALIVLMGSPNCFSKDTLSIRSAAPLVPRSMERQPRPPKEGRPGNGFGKRFTLGLAFGIGPDWLNPHTDSLYRNGPVVGLKYGIPFDINFTDKENYYFTSGIFFQHSGGNLSFQGIGEGTDSLLLPVERRYSAIYLTIPTGIKLKTPSMKGFVIAANFGLYHSFRLNAKASDRYELLGEDVQTEKYMYTEKTSLFRESGYIGLGTEYVVTGSFRVYFYALYHHTFTNFFNPKNSHSLADETKDRASIGGVELQIGLCF